MGFQFLWNLIFDRFYLGLIILIDDILWIRNHVVLVVLKTLVELSADQAEFAELRLNIEEFYYIRKNTRTDF